MRDAHPDLEVEVHPVKTRGDKDLRSFSAIGGKGLFVAEVEQEVAEGRADLAVHSAKDLTADLASGCSILCVPRRAPAHDVIVGASGIEDLPSGATVGTSSMRRRALLAEVRPDLDVVDFRGNLDTRLKKVEDGEVDAAILAAAGLHRLGVTAGEPIDPERWVPAPGQGALAIEGRMQRHDLVELLAPLNDYDAAAELACERAFSARLEGGCSVPLGCLARSANRKLTVTGYLGLPDGSHALRDRIAGPASAASELGADLAAAIYDCGGRDILEELREADTTAPSPP